MAYFAHSLPLSSGNIRGPVLLNVNCRMTRDCLGQMYFKSGPTTQRSGSGYVYGCSERVKAQSPVACGVV